MTENTWGGKREGSGRKTKENKKITKSFVISPEILKKLEEKGVEIISCGTCLDYYELKEKLLVGEISNMYTIYETLFNAGKVINI